MLFPPKEKTGRSGLAEIAVTPVHYLYFLDQLERGENVSFRKAQLDLAFATYLRQNDGAWSNEQAKNLKNLEDFAATYIDSEREKLHRQQKNSKLPLSQQQQKALALMQKLGVAPIDKKDLPHNLRGHAPDEKQQATREISRSEMALTLAETLIEVAVYAEPGAASAAVVIAANLAPGVAMHGSRILFDKLEKRADNSAEEKVCVAGLHEVMGEPEKHALSGQAALLQHKIRDPEARAEFAALKPVADMHEIAAEKILAAAREEAPISIRRLEAEFVPVRLDMFRNNTDMAATVIDHPHLIKPGPVGWKTKK